MSSGLVANLAQALRSLGLDIFNYILWGRLAPEPRKFAVRQSSWLALSRCSIHVLPVVISTYLIQLILRGHYIGEHLTATKDNQADNVALAFIQIAAKIQVTSDLHGG